MPEYCADEDLEGLLPSNHGFTSGQLLAFRVAGSDKCDGWIRRRFRCPLPNYNDTPGTPQDVREASAQYAALLAHMRLGIRNQLTEGRFLWDMKKIADEGMREYAEGKRDLPTVVITGEEMTFGEVPLDDNQYKLEHSVRLIDPETVEIDGFKYGEDFRVEYMGRFRGWVLTRSNPEIEDGAEVSYEYTYAPNAMEIKDDLAPGSMRIFR